MTSRLDVFSRPSMVAACRLIDRHGSIAADDFPASLLDGFPLPAFIHLLESLGLITQSADVINATRELRRSLVLIETLDGGDLDHCINTLRSLYPALDKISIVYQQMTRTFLKMLFNESSMGSVSICSPWINITANEQRRLKWLVAESARLGEEWSLTIVTRPVTVSSPSAAPLAASLDFFQSLGADVILNKSVHAKAYIRLPGRGGGAEFAVIGSENLTVPKYLELGLLIRNDSSLINKLVGAFFEIAGRGL